MSNLNYPFAPVAHEDWVLQIQKELRDQTERMLFKDSIEGLELDVIEPVSIITPIDFSSFRDSVNNVHFERIQTEKESNRCMLLALMQGANALFIQIEKAEVEKIQSRDYLRYGNPNNICYEIARGRISPWMLYQSDSGVQFLSTLRDDQQKMIMDYIDPEQWALKFNRDPANVKQVKELLNAGGY